MEHLAQEDDDHGDEEKNKEHSESPRMTGSDVTHSIHRGTDYVTRVCADVTNTRAVAVSLNSPHRKNAPENNLRV